MAMPHGPGTAMLHGRHTPSGSLPVSPESLQKFRQRISRRDSDQPEFLQAADEVLDSLWDYILANPRYAEHALLERLLEPERVIQFRICWVDDAGQTHVNRGFRV